MNRTVKIVWLCKTENGWRRFPVLAGNNGRIRTGAVLIDGKEKKYPNGSFQLRTYERSKTVYLPAGKTTPDAEKALKLYTTKQRMEIDAETVGIVLPQETTRMKVWDGSKQFIQRTKEAQAPVAAAVYEHAIDELIHATKVVFVDEITADTMLAFHAAMRKRGNSDRTISNKHLRVCAFLRWAGVDIKKLDIRVPKHEKKLPSVYAQGDVETLLASDIEPYWRMVVQILRQTGLREQEAIHLQWGDIDFTRKVLRVRSKIDLNFRVKDREERDIPLPDGLISELKEWKKENPDSTFVLGTAGDKPNQKLLRGLKRLVHRAGLDCKTCEGCLERNECRKWTLHAWRRTYATSLSRAGIDARTIMAFMGHADIETTMRYLAAMDADNAQPIINSVKW